MSFTTEIKNEICSNTYSRLENICLLSAYIRNSAEINKDKIEIFSLNPKVIRKIFTLFKELFDANPTIIQGKSVSPSKKNYYSITIIEKIDLILQTLMATKNDNQTKLPDYFLEDEDLKRAYLRGAFLAKGSINDPKKSRYHLEFLVDTKEEAKTIKDLLGKFNINSNIISREKGYMTYVKEAEKIGDFLRIISANNAILYYEDIRIYRDHKNMTNRLNNCEQANVDKIIASSNKHLEDINIIKEKLGLDSLEEKLKDVITYREKYPEVSLAELAYIISKEKEKNITKSGLSHRFRKIHEIATKLKND